MNQMYLVLGDWSDDGHGKSDKILIEANKTVKEIQDAYKASCKLTKVSFDEGKHSLCNEYQDSSIPKEVMEIFKKFNFPFTKDDFDKDPEGNVIVDKDVFVKMFMWFVGLSLDGLEWKETKDSIPCINGYWNKNLNISIGYGLYD